MIDRVAVLRELIAQSERLIRETNELMALHRANLEEAEALLRELTFRFPRAPFPADPLRDYRPTSAVEEQELMSVG